MIIEDYCCEKTAAAAAAAVDRPACRQERILCPQWSATVPVHRSLQGTHCGV